MVGYFQIYTGNGKGKTTASLGLALRAAGSGLRVLFAQFVKGMEYNEISALKRFDDFITVQQFGRGCFIINEPVQEDIDEAIKGLDYVKKALSSGDYDLVILDEANIALYYKLFSIDDLIDVIINRHKGCEVVVTGRNAPQRLIEIADLVTEMKDIKHYYNVGVKARDGIER